MQFSAEKLKDQIPFYLTKERQEGLMKALEDFPRKIDYYLDDYKDDLLQGDGWTALDVIQFETGDRKNIRGIVLSNSCDISEANERALPPRLVFAPLIRLQRFVEALKVEGLKNETIEAKLTSIRNQEVTTVFYLPQGGQLDSEYIALLDDLHTIPVKHFAEKGDRTKLFTLGMAGFYLFLFKLSVHFCRFHENVAR